MRVIVQRRRDIAVQSFFWNMFLKEGNSAIWETFNLPHHK